ncbi:MAG TPA: hypothetical protein VF432_08800 [Thermoanaerobaculia bacterium]
MCTNCRTLYFEQAKNVCAAGGQHTPASEKYKLLQAPAPSFATQDKWKRCTNCGAFYYSGKRSYCPAVRPHDGTGSPDYRVETVSVLASPGPWRHCLKCGGLHWAGEGIQGCPIPSANELPKFDMGGTDGQLVTVDRNTDDLYMTHRCVGSLPDHSSQSHFELSPYAINKTLIARLRKDHSSWTTHAILNQNVWRTSLVALKKSKTLVAGVGSWVFPGLALGGGHFFWEGLDAGGAAAGWDGFENTVPTISSNIWEHGLTARTPGTDSVFVAWGDSSSTRGHGYRLSFLADGTFSSVPPTGKFVEATEHTILPTAGNPDDYVLHLQAVDIGTGPVLLSWKDVDSAAKTVTIRGRFITGPNQFTSDFTISQAAGAPREFAAKPSRWYGDYQTGGGYVGPFSYIYFPVWVEPDGVHYGRVEYVKPVIDFSPPQFPLTATSSKQVQAVQQPPLEVKPESQYKPDPRPENRMRDQ